MHVKSRGGKAESTTKSQPHVTTESMGQPMYEARWAELARLNKKPPNFANVGNIAPVNQVRQNLGKGKS